MRRHATSIKLLTSVALGVGAAGIAGLGTFGSFTSSTSASTAVADGTLTIGMAQPVTRGLDVGATGLVPGDVAQRTVTLTRAADSETFGSVVLSTGVGVTAISGPLDPANTPWLQVDTCATDWTTTASSRQLTCAGPVTTVLSRRPIVGAGGDLGAAVTDLNSSGRTSRLRISVGLPEAAGNDYQGLAGTVSFTFDATQRAAETR